MDKKNTLIGVLLLIAAFASFYLAPKAPPPAHTPSVTQPATNTPSTAGNQAQGPATSALPAVSPADAAFSAVATEDGSDKILTLANDYVEIRLTDMGGAVKNVAFKKYPAHLGSSQPFVFNATHVDPILAFTRDSFPGLDRSVRYEVVSATATEVVFRAVFEKRVEVLRRYSLEGPGKRDPYQIRHETTFRNLSDQTAILPRAALSAGTTALLDAHDTGQYLNFGYNTGKDFENIERSDLESGSGFFGLGAHAAPPYVESTGNTLWAAAKNQYFASIITPDAPATGTIARLVTDLAPVAGTTRPNAGIAGALRFDLPTLAPAATATLGMNVYVGPKEYRRLSDGDIFKHDEDKVMDYTNFFFNRIFLAGYFAPLMNQLMSWTASWVHNWGWAIILGTLLIKIATLPFNLAAARSAKRMQKLAPEMKAIQEKYKDNKQKQQMALMELYKERKVNPMGGCLPMLIPLPFFIGMFAMLQGAPELRYQSFFWAKDLAGPDTVAHIAGFPINILPLLLGVTMIFQMRLMPQPNMADNEQAKMMAKMMKWMPLIYVVFCYSFSCALSLYSTVNGLFMIGQQLVVNRMKDPEFAAASTPKGSALNTMKNVTPGKKKKG